LVLAKVGLAERAAACFLALLARDVALVHAQVAARLETRLHLQHHDRVRLLAARAARAPDRDRARARPAAARLQRRDDLLDQRLELLALAQEVGLVGGQVVDRPGELALAGGVAA